MKGQNVLTPITYWLFVKVFLRGGLTRMVMLTQEEETSLIAQAKDNSSAFTELYNYYFTRIYNYVHYRVAGGCGHACLEKIGDVSVW